MSRRQRYISHLFSQTHHLTVCIQQNEYLVQKTPCQAFFYKTLLEIFRKHIEEISESL